MRVREGMNIRPAVSPYELHCLRSDASSFIRDECPTFVTMDCNAQFSKIFREHVFSDINRLTVFCETCERSCLVNNEYSSIIYLSSICCRLATHK